MDGILVINKPKGCTSHDIVYKVKKLTGEKVGHTGTLDPNATGVLPLLIGKGTSASKYLINHDKTYKVVLKLGEKKDTADSEGKTIEEKNVDETTLKENIIKDILNSLKGKQEQIPPIYSAIKVKGKKLYEYARKGEKIDIKPRQIEIYNIDLINIDKENKEINFKVCCSKGTYIRSLCETIASKLNTVGYMKELERIEVGEFNIKDAITIEELQENYQNQEFMQKYFITLEKQFMKYPNIRLNESDLKKLLNGVKLNTNLKDGLCKIYDKQNNFIGIATIQKGELKRDIIL